MSLPSYCHLDKKDWEERIAAADALATPCRLCPRRCKVDRSKNSPGGFCRAPGGPKVSSFFPHHGEEPPISGVNGSGTIFFSHCTLRCIFCQNWQISHEGEGEACTTADCAGMMLNLQSQGCHNINLVTPTHFLPWILRALREAAAGGLHIPLVYNSSGYELPQALEALDKIVDIYLPDMKYGDNDAAGLYSGAPDYVEVNQEAIRAMFRQVGPLKVDKDNIAVRGVCIRHLVLPGNQAHSEKIVEFLSVNFDPQEIFISLMAQYRPLYKACDYPQINRQCTFEEYDAVRTLFIDKGFEGFYQEHAKMDEKFVIDFKKRKTEPLTGE